MNKRFTSKDITLSSLAQEIGTNSTYLSKYINAVKAENFSTYLGDLRIQYVLKELYSSPVLRNYTIQAIAKEIGFTTAKSFNNHFKRVTELSASYFLKKLEMQEPLSKRKKEATVIDFIDRIHKTG